MIKVIDVKDFSVTNRWKALKKKFRSPTEIELLEYIELLEQQIVLLNKSVEDLEDIANSRGNGVYSDDRK